MAKLGLCVLLLPALVTIQVHAAQLPAASRDCVAAIAEAERQEGIPKTLLYAIALTESGRRFSDGSFGPWPWTLNADGQGLYADGIADATAMAQRLLSQGVRNIDMGCMQVSSQFHPRAFGSLQEAFQPLPNALYAARLLRSLYQRLGSWDRAVAHYHSATPERGEAYRAKVFAIYGGDLRSAMAEAEQRERLQGPLLAATRLLAQNPAEAIEAFSYLLTANPEDPIALAGRAMALQRVGRNDAAFEDLRRLYRQTPGDRQVWSKLTQALSSQPMTQRLNNLERLAEDHPEDRRIRDWLARDALAIGDEARAFVHKFALLELSPNEGRLYLDTASLAERLGRVVDALHLCESALRLPQIAKTPALVDHLNACVRRLRHDLAQRGQDNPIDGLSRH